MKRKRNKRLGVIIGLAVFILLAAVAAGVYLFAPRGGEPALVYAFNTGGGAPARYPDAAFAVALQLLWAVFIIAAGALLMKKALRKTVVYGG